MLILYSAATTDFNNMGLGPLPNPSKIVITNEINGSYFLEIVYTIDKIKSYSNIENRCIIKVTDYKNQLFRIVTIGYLMDKINIRAEHISNDLINNISAENLYLDTPNQLQIFLNKLNNNLLFANAFTFTSYISNSYTNAPINYGLTNPLEIFLSFNQGEEDQSIVKLFNCQIDRDNFNIGFKESIGEDRGVQLRFRKNINDFNLLQDYSTLITDILPVSNDGITIPNLFYPSPYINNYDQPLPKKYIFTDITQQEGESILAVQNKLIKRCQQLYNLNKVDLPNNNIKVKFQDLTITNEYKNNNNYVSLEKVNLGDTITVVIDYLNIKFKAQIIRVNINILVPAQSELEISTFRFNLWDDLIEMNNKINTINKL